VTDKIDFDFLLRDGTMSKIIIDEDNNLSYVGGQKFICGIDKATIYDDPSTADILKNNAHTQFISEDYVAVNITAKIGKVGIKEFASSVEFDVAAEGEIGLQVIKKLKEIKSSLPSKDPELIVKNYHDFANSILDQTGSNELYKQEIREEVRNILSSSDDLEPQKIANLKKLEFTKTVLAEQLMDKIDKKMDDFKKNHPDQVMTSREITGVANEVAVDLKKFVAIPQGYLERFSKDLVDERLSSNEVDLPRQSFANKIDELYKQEIREEVRNILSSSDNLEPQKIANLKKLEFTKTVLAEQLMDKIDKKMDDFKKNHPDQLMTSREITGVANEVAVDLQKFVAIIPQGYLERFSKDLVDERLSSNEVDLPRQSFVNKIDELYKQEVREEIREEVRNILSSSNDVEPQKIENLKKLEFTKTALAEQLMDKIDKKMDDFKKNHPDQPVTSREITGVANEVTVDLQKFIDKPQGYLERFAKDLVKERVSEFK
jgi:predicted phage tail protein